MNESAVNTNKWTFISISTVLALFLIIVDVLIISEERDYLFQTEKRHVANELDLMSKFITEVMIKNDYGTVEEYIPEWGGARKDVIMASIKAPNGFEVAHFERKTESHFLYKLKKSIFYSGKRIFDMEIQWDFGSIYSHIYDRTIKLVTLSIAAVIILGMVLWQALKRAAILPLQRHIEERAIIEDSLENHARDLSMYVEELESYSYSIAHDLRAPVRSVTSFSQLLLLDAKDKLSPEDVKTVQRIVSAGKYMAELIDDILSMAKITRENMQMKSINLSAMANNSVNQLRELYPERDCEVAIEPNLTARGDSRLVQLLLDNLIGNAWKYTGRRDRAHIEFGKQNGAEKNIFFVKDDGIGFDMKYADKLFHPFQRLHPKEEFEGTGIGLATSRRIVNRHGGKIWAESQPDKGSIFYFTL